MSTIANSTATAIQKSRDWMKGMIYAAVGIALLSLITYQLAIHKPSDVATNKQSRNAVMVLSMAANGPSSHVSAPPSYAVAFTGSGFTTHCVYSDGSAEGVVGSLTNPCHNGPMLYQFVVDITGNANSVTYEFVRPK